MLDKMRDERVRRIGGAIVGVAIALILGIFFHPRDLSLEGCAVLSILAGAIVWWICNVLPEFATALIMVGLFTLIAGVSSEASFSFFSDSIWWLLVGAFSIGLGMRETGLLERMALAIVSRFPSSFAAQIIGFFACGTILSPLIPSMAAKASLLSPLTLEVSDVCGYARQGPQATGLFLSMFTGLQTAAPTFISSSIIGYALLALYPADVQAQFDFVTWFLMSLPWLVPMIVLNLLFLIILYRPRKATKGHPVGSQEPVPSPSSSIRDTIAEKYRELGPMSKAERRMSLIVGATVVLWTTQGLHGIAAWIPAVGALVAMCACGIIAPKGLSSGIDWGSLIFIGIVLGLGDVFNEAGLTDWIVKIFAPMVVSLAANPYLLVFGLAIITILARFLIVSQTAFLNIFLAFVIPIALTLGINPWVIGMACYAVINVWFVKYQNPVYLAAFYSVEGKMVKQSKAVLYCLVYTGISILSLLIAVPFWQLYGLF